MMKTRWMDQDAPSNDDIRNEILRLLMSLRIGETICPMDAGRNFGSKWRQQMPLVREVAADMVRDGMIEVLLRGDVIDIDERSIESIRGPIRLRLRPKTLQSALEADDEDKTDSDETTHP
jgi:hypothetical protein